MRIFTIIFCLFLSVHAIGQTADTVAKHPSVTTQFRGTTLHSKKILIVVDGVIYKDNLKNIDPNSIAGVSVLKPNMAKIKSGKLGENGAVIIETKNGAVPLYEKKLSVLSQDYKSYLLAHNNDDAAIYYVINGEVINNNPGILDNKLDKLLAGQITSAVFFEKWSKTLNNEHILLVIKTK